jgi:hypothetical protein
MCGRSEGEQHGGGSQGSLGPAVESGSCPVSSRCSRRWRSLAGGGPVWADVAEFLGGGLLSWRSLAEGNNVRGVVRSAPSGGQFGEHPQSKMTQRCTKRQQQLPTAALSAWNSGAWQEAE